MTQEEKIKNHVVSLETAKKLKEAGWRKETLYYLEEHKILETVIVRRFDERDKENCERLHDFSAPLATELLEEFEDSVSIKKFKYDYIVYYYDLKTDKEFMEKSECPQEALAQMWLYLKENNLK